MSLKDNYWESYIEKVKDRITETVNSSSIGDVLQDELLDLYKILDDNDLAMGERKRKAVLAEHYLNIISDTPYNNNRRR